MIDFDKVLFIDKYQLKSLQGVARRNFLLSRVRECFLGHPAFAKNITRQAVFFKSMVRPDYDAFFTEVVTGSGLQARTIDIAVRLGWLNPLFFLQLLLSLPLLFTFEASSLKQRAFLYLRLCHYQLIARRFFAGQPYDFITVFADMQPLDSLICQQARQKNIPTATFQHGLYVDYAQQNNINCINYQGHVADFFLAWGEDTKALITKYRPDARVTVVGKPLQPVAQRKAEGYFTVVFDQNIFHSYNKELLEISYTVARCTGLKINLRLHPHNKLGWYRVEPDLLLQDQDLLGSSFVLGHTTSMLYELMRQGVPAFKFKSRVPANVLDDALKFATVDELQQILARYLEQGFDFAGYARHYISHLGQDSIAQYRTFFQQHIPAKPTDETVA